MDPSDDRLLGAIATGDETALRIFYLRHETPLYAFLVRILNDTFEAHDILNETMLEVWRKADRFEGRSKVRTWLYSIARNRALDRLRRVRRQPTGEIDPEIPDEALPEADARLIDAEHAAQVAHCLDRIRPRFREVLHLAFFADMAQAEIGTVLGCPEGTVKSRLHHAKRAMQHCLESLTGRRR